MGLGGNALRGVYLIWLCIPYRAWSSGRNSSGLMLADKSFCMPVCLPRRKAAIFEILLAPLMLKELSLAARGKLERELRAPTVFSGGGLATSSMVRA